MDRGWLQTLVPNLKEPVAARDREGTIEVHLFITNSVQIACRLLAKATWMSSWRGTRIAARFRVRVTTSAARGEIERLRSAKYLRISRSNLVADARISGADPGGFPHTSSAMTWAMRAISVSSAISA